MTLLPSKVFFVLLLAFNSVQGTLMPNGVIALDCGSQQTFTCSVTNFAVWTIEGLDGISVSSDTGEVAGRDNTRINTTETGVIPSSTITISGFSSLDDGGTIQCIDLNNPSVIQGMANISVEPPSCPTNFSANRDGDFTSATVTYQLATPPPVTSTTVTYCPTSDSSPNCGNSVNCTSPCTISGLDPCVTYNLTATLTNNCGTTNCTGDSMVPGKGIPSCPVMVDIHNSSQSETEPLKCDVSLTWQEPPNTPPVTSTTVTYCPTSSPNCGNITCTSPCTIRGLLNNTEHQFTVIPNNNCGIRTGCNGTTVQLRSDCTIIFKEFTNPTITTTPPGDSNLLLLLLLLLLLIPLLSHPIGVLIVQRCCYKDKSYCEVFWCCWCCGCCAGGESKRSSSTRPIPVDNYADPKEVREKKEKEEKIQYAALEFSEQAGSSGEKPIRSKEEPVQYLSVEQA